MTDRPTTDALQAAWREAFDGGSPLALQRAHALIARLLEEREAVLAYRVFAKKAPSDTHDYDTRDDAWEDAYEQGGIDTLTDIAALLTPPTRKEAP